MRILLTGARGFVGRHLYGELVNNDHDVIGVDISDGDLRVDKVASNIIKEKQPELVVHLAGVVGRMFGEDDPERTVTTNAVGTLRVAQACAQAKVRVAYVSTSEAYGDWGDDSVDEKEHGKLPHNLYGLSKRWGEEVTQLYYGAKAQIPRLSMPYGPGLPAGRGRAALINFLWSAMHWQPITVFRGASRSWCWVGDTVRGLRMILEDGGAGVWLVGRDDNETSMLRVAQMCCDITGAPHSIIKELDPPTNETPVKRLKTARLNALGWQPETSLEAGIAITYESMKQYTINGEPPSNTSFWRKQ